MAIFAEHRYSLMVPDGVITTLYGRSLRCYPYTLEASLPGYTGIFVYCPLDDSRRVVGLATWVTSDRLLDITTRLPGIDGICAQAQADHSRDVPGLIEGICGIPLPLATLEAPGPWGEPDTDRQVYSAGVLELAGFRAKLTATALAGQPRPLWVSTVVVVTDSTWGAFDDG